MHYLARTLTIIYFAIFSSNVMALPIGLVGDEIDAAVIRTIDSPGFGFGRICCFGLESPFVVEDGAIDQKQYSSSFLLDVNAFSFSLNYIGFGGWQDGIILRISDLDFSNNLQYLSDLHINTNVIGLSWLVGSDFIDLHLGGTRQDNGTYINGRFLVASIPEPSSLSLLFISFVVMVLIYRMPRYNKNNISPAKGAG